MSGDNLCELCRREEAVTGVREVRLCSECFNTIANNENGACFTEFLRLAASRADDASKRAVEREHHIQSAIKEQQRAVMDDYVQLAEPLRRIHLVHTRLRQCVQIASLVVLVAGLLAVGVLAIEYWPSAWTWILGSIAVVVFSGGIRAVLSELVNTVAALSFSSLMKSAKTSSDAIRLSLWRDSVHSSDDAFMVAVDKPGVLYKKATALMGEHQRTLGSAFSTWAKVAEACGYRHDPNIVAFSLVGVKPAYRRLVARALFWEAAIYLTCAENTRLVRRAKTKFGGMTLNEKMEPTWHACAQRANFLIGQVNGLVDPAICLRVQERADRQLQVTLADAKGDPKYKEEYSVGQTGVPLLVAYDDAILRSGLKISTLAEVVGTLGYNEVMAENGYVSTKS